MPDQTEHVLTKQEFLDYLQKNLHPWLSNRPRSLEAHLLGIEEWAEKTYNDLHKKSTESSVI